MSLSSYIHAMGRGPARGRHLERAEACDAMAQILAGKAEPEAVGALFMLMRYRGETAEEIAGFVDAMRAVTAPWQDCPADVDWPVYAAGRSRGLPYLLLAAKLLARAGYRVVLHGWNSHQNPIADVRAALPELGISMAATPGELTDELARARIGYVRLETLSPKLLELVQLRSVLGLRSPVNTALRALNPCGSDLSLQGVFHPAYRDLQQDAARVLGQRHMAVLKGAGGEFERHPSKTIAVRGLKDGAPFESAAEPLMDEARRLRGGERDQSALAALWAGDYEDEFSVSVVIGTAALALERLGAGADAQAEAEALWQARHRAMAA